jgi:hypothetical protein
MARRGACRAPLAEEPVESLASALLSEGGAVPRGGEPAAGRVDADVEHVAAEPVAAERVIGLEHAVVFDDVVETVGGAEGG